MLHITFQNTIKFKVVIVSEVPMQFLRTIHLHDPKEL